MTKINRKNIYLFMFLTFLMNILLRYPHDNYEVGWDSYLYHKVAESSIRFGTVPYHINFSSFFGLTPGSHQSALIVHLAEFYSISGLEMGWVIWLCPLFYSFIGCLGMFLLVRKISNNLTISMLATLLFTCSNIIVYLTYWTAATRGLLLFIIPFLFYFQISLMIDKTKRIEKSSIYIFLIIITISIHRISLLIFIVLGIFFIIYKIIKYLSNLKFNKIIFLLICYSIFFTLFPYFIKIPTFEYYIYYQLQDKLLLFNIIFLSYRINPIYILFALFCILKFYRNTSNKILLSFIICLLLLLPLLIIAEYVLIPMIILIIIIASFGWKLFSERKIEIKIIVIVLIIFIYTLFFNWVHLGLVKEWLGTESSERSIDIDSYSVDIYLKYEIDENDVLLTNGDKVTTLIPNPTMPNHYITDLQYGFIKDDSEYQILPIEKWPDNIYELKYNNPRNDYYLIMIVNDKNKLEKYNISYLIEDKTKNDTVLWGAELNSPLLKLVSNEKYSLYENNRYIVWKM